MNINLIIHLLGSIFSLKKKKKKIRCNQKKPLLTKKNRVPSNYGNKGWYFLITMKFITVLKVK